VLDTVNY